jgi:hypothetical protein
MDYKVLVCCITWASHAINVGAPGDGRLTYSVNLDRYSAPR